MNYDFDRGSNIQTKYSLMRPKIHSNYLHISNRAQNPAEHIKNIVSSFRQGVLQSKSKSKFKTSKNSPDRIFFAEQMKFIQNRNIDNINNIINNINPNSNHNQKNKISLIQNESGIDAIIKKKIIKIKEKNKSSVTASNTGNNSNSLINNTVSHTMQSNNNSQITNFIPNSNILSKTKSKISIESNIEKKKHKVNSFNPYQKRSNSAFDQDLKQMHQKQTNIYAKFAIVSTKQNHIGQNGNNNVKQNHIKNSSLFTSTLSALNRKMLFKMLNSGINRNNNSSSSLSKQMQKQSYGVKMVSKTSNHSKISSRKYSTDRDKDKDKKTLNHSNNKYSSSNQKSLNMPFTYYLKQNHFFNNKNLIEKEKEKPIQDNNNNINPNIQNYHNILNDYNEFKALKNNLLENHNNNNHIAQYIEKNEINNNEDINNKNKNNHYSKKLSSQINQKIVINMPTSSNKDKDNLNKKQDHDLDNIDNKNDIFLNTLNNNIDNNDRENNINDSFDSVQSLVRENNKIHICFKDMEYISLYIKKYYQKYKKYPSTKMRFYKYGRLLGKGAFGKVNLGLHVLTGRLVAIKSINKTNLTSERKKKKIAVEASIMKTLSHSNYIVKIYETYETQKHICIVMEYVCAGDLLSYIRKRNKLNESTAKYLFKQIILSLQYIHKQNIVHLDIKLDNILIDFDNNIRICDFGVSQRIKLGSKIDEQCGTPAYIAPEILKNKGYEGFGVDIWSSGVVLYAMLSGTVPFKGANLQNLHELIMKGDFEPVKEVSKEANNLIKCILEVEPRKRIAIADILNHPWLIDVDVTQKNKYNLFTNAERIILAKKNVDYRNNNNKEEAVENFTLRNIDTFEEKVSKNNNTKSVILAPFNSSIDSDFDEAKKEKYLFKYHNDSLVIINKEITIRNNLIKFGGKVKEINRNYELNNNGEIDNGVIISPNDSNKEKDISPNNDSFSKGHSKHFSPFNEVEENYSNNNNNNINSNNNNNINSNNINSNNGFSSYSFENEEVLNEMTTLGYSKQYIQECLKKDEFNYATAGYYLLNKSSVLVKKQM